MKSDKINLSSEISQHTKCILNASNGHNYLPNAILRASATHGTWLLYQIWTKSTTFSFEISQQTQKLWKNDHHCKYLTQSQIVFYMNQQPMVPDHGAKYEENPVGHHRGMNEDRQTHNTCSYISQFCYCGTGNNKNVSESTWFPR